MAEPKTTIWDIEPHTAAKHALLKRYLEAWFPILASWNEKVFLIDGFAGPGRYEGGEPGSPAIAVAAAAKSERLLKGSRVLFLFNESNAKRHAELVQWAEDSESTTPDNFDVYVENKEFADLAEQIVSDRGDRRLVPTFAFVDPFGWKGLPMQLISDLVRDKRSELFILFSFNSVNRFITHPDDKITNHFDELFGTTEYLDAVGLQPADRKEFLASLYEEQLRKVGRFEHVSRFEMIESSGRTSYFLYHCTRSLKGLEVMRSAMWKIDPLRGCQFSDVVAGLDPLDLGPLTVDLDERLRNAFYGQTVSMNTLKRFVLTETELPLEKLKKDTLKPMQQAGLIEVLDQKRRFTFPDYVSVSFVN